MRATRGETARLTRHLGVALVGLGMVATCITVLLRRSNARPQVLGVAAIGLAVLFTATSQVLCLSIIGQSLRLDGPAQEPALCPVEQPWPAQRARQDVAAH